MPVCSEGGVCVAVQFSLPVPPSHLLQIAGVNYGGHVTDDWDRRVLSTYINEFFAETVLETAYYKWVPHKEGTATPTEGCLTTPCCVCAALSPGCPPYPTTTSPRTDHSSPTRTTLNSCRPWTARRPSDSTPTQTSPARSGRRGVYAMWSHDSHVTSSRLRVVHCYTLRCCLIRTGTCVCLASPLAGVCCSCSVWHSPLVFTSVSPSKVVDAACLAAGPCWTHWCHCSHSAQ